MNAHKQGTPKMHIKRSSEVDSIKYCLKLSVRMLPLQQVPRGKGSALMSKFCIRNFLSGGRSKEYEHCPLKALMAFAVGRDDQPGLRSQAKMITSLSVFHSD